MSNPRLPPEILDYIVDILHAEPETLKECCLVSKSWVPRTRKYLFATIEFNSESHLESWMKTFPDPSDSPAFHTNSLAISCTQVIRTAGGWIQTFPRITNLQLSGIINQRPRDPKAPLVPFYKFSPTLKSLYMHCITLPYPELFTLVCSSPLLEDLTLTGHEMLSWSGDDPRGVVTSASPLLTGSLKLTIPGGMEYTARQLLNLPNGLHFRTLKFSWTREDDLRWIMELVVGCSESLEYLDLTLPGAFLLILGWGNGLPSFVGSHSPTPLDLSKATKLRHVTFRSGSQKVDWITMVLQTITPKNRELRQVSIHVPYELTCFDVGYDIRKIVGEADYRQWLDLDCLLIQLWESHSIRPRVVCTTLWENEQNTKYCIGCLLPEITGRGMIYLI